MHHADTVTPENCHTHSAGGPRVPLSFVRAGKEATVQSVSGKDETKRFLGSLGLVEGAHVCVISEMNGDVIVKVKGTRVAISKSMARRVMTV
ncbi:MAG TPA: ferrous iron transport protein A [Ruminococcaceae bacterium]|nr:ferrous iron transport protein A [Oscillospiraceae bacterium]